MKQKKIVKKVIGHLKEDKKDYLKGIREDVKLATQLKRMARNRGK